MNHKALVLLAALSVHAIAAGQSGGGLGLRSEQALIRGELGDDERAASLAQVRADLEYVKKNFVDDMRHSQGWGRTVAQAFRAADAVPYVGALGLGRDFVDWQTGKMDAQLAQWATYGLEKLKAEGKLSLATPGDVANMLLSSRGPFKDDPDVVREAVASFVVRHLGANVTDLQARITSLAKSAGASQRLTGQRLQEFLGVAKKLEQSQLALENESKAIKRRLEPSDAERAQDVLRGVSANAQAIASLFPNDKNVQKISSFVGRAAEFGSYAVLAAGTGGAAFVLPAIASGMSLLKGGGRSESAAVLAALRRLETIINERFIEVNTKLDAIYSQTLLITALVKQDLLQELWLCGEILRTNKSGDKLLPNSRLYRIELGPAFGTREDLEAVFSLVDQRLPGCKAGLQANFPTDAPAAVFRLSVGSDDPDWQVGDLAIPQAQRKLAAEYLGEQLTTSLSALSPLLGKRSLHALSEPSAISVASLKEKIAAIERLEKEPTLDEGAFSLPLNPGLVARAGGYALAMHNTFVLIGGDRFTGKADGSPAAGRSLTDGVYLVVTRTAAQQRMVAGDALLPIVSAIRHEPDIKPGNIANWKSWIERGWLPASFPADVTPSSQKEYKRIRDGILVALTVNRQLRENVLTWELQSDLIDIGTVNRVRIALAARSFALLPRAWLSVHGVRWQTEDKPKNVSAGWRYSFDTATQPANKKAPVKYGRAEVSLPSTEDILDGQLSLGPSLPYMEKLESFARRELTSYAFVDAVAKKADVGKAARRLLEDKVDPLLLVD